MAAQGSADGGNISASSALLRSADESVQKLRNVIKFLISYCNEAAAADLNLDNISYDELMYTDQYMLALLRDFRNQVRVYRSSITNVILHNSILHIRLQRIMKTITITGYS